MVFWPIRSHGDRRPIDGTQCDGCHRPLVWVGDEVWCRFCGQIFCPFCYRSWAEECEHLLAIQHEDGDFGWILSPFKMEEPAELPMLPDQVYSGSEPSEQLVRRAFGDLFPLIEAYQNGVGERVDQVMLFEYIVERVKLPLIRVVWDPDVVPGASRPGAAYAFDFFTDDRKQWHAEIHSIILELERGFERLADFLTSTPIKPVPNDEQG